MNDTCVQCGVKIDKPKDTYLDYHERKTATVVLCSVDCLVAYVKED